MIQFFKITLHFSVIYSKCCHEYKKIFEEKESIEILKIVALITNIEECQKIYTLVCRKHNSRTQTEKYR